MVAPAETCALCGLKISGAPVIRNIAGQEKHFCCQGCARVYEVAQQNGVLDQVLPRLTTKPTPVRLTERVRNPGQTAYFSLNGMWCAGCASAAEQLLRHQTGIKDASVSFAAQRGRIQYDATVADPAVLLAKLDGLGYRAHLLTDPAEQRAERQEEYILWQLLTAAAFGMQVMVLYIVQLYPLYGMGQFDSPDVRRLQYVVWLLTTPILVYGGLSFLRGAWRALLARTATMDTLVALGTLAAYGYSVYVTLVGGGQTYFDSVGMITTFVMVGRYLEAIGGARARKDIRRLMQLQPAQAWRRTGQTWAQVPARTLLRGDEILVKAGERVPADAQVLDGEGSVDESLLTGESAPVSKAPGETIYAGALLAENALVARVTKEPQDTRLAQITRMVEQTLATKPPVQRLADKASAYFAFGILAVALLTAVGWLLSGQALSRSLLTAVAVLVVACPCALGLATPLALAVTLGRSAGEGILVRNPAALEIAGKIQRVVFDKTGTLTLGQLTVVAAGADHTQVESEEALRCIAAAVEQFSEHPIARAIVKSCNTPLPEAGGFQSLRGLGASAQVKMQSEQRVMVGSSAFFGIDRELPLSAQTQPRVARGETVIWVGWGNAIAGFLALRDEPNPTVKPALQQLQAQGIKSVMLSGDNPRTTQAIAAELGLADYQGNCSPQEKAARIGAWQTSGELVAMVGDGVNDAPALAQANISITAMGGSDIAGETSDMLLTRADLTLIPWFIALSRRTRTIILENLGWAFAYNLVSVPLAAFGLISPAIAAVTMAVSSLLVVGNSLRLSR